MDILYFFEEFNLYFGNYEKITRVDNNFYLPYKLLKVFLSNKKNFILFIEKISLEKRIFNNIISDWRQKG